MAKKLHNELPPKPLESLRLIPFAGSFRTYLSCTLNASRSKRSLAFWNTILLGVKRACAPPDDSFVAAAYEDHAEALSKAPPPCPMSLVQKTHELLGKRPRPRMPRIQLSNSASLNCSRGVGGGAEEVIRSHNGLVPRTVAGRVQDPFAEPLCPHELLRIVEVSSGRLEYVYGREVPTIDELRRLCQTSSSRRCVRAVGLLEPLKCRVITCGDAPMQSLMETIRKPIHDRLRTLPGLELLGRPLQKGDLVSLCAKADSLGMTGPDVKWVSGDFKAATDNLSAGASRQVAAALIDWTGRVEDMEFVMESLFGTVLQYPEPKGVSSMSASCPGTPQKEIQQSTGQLMGNPMSFPILSIVNFIGFWKALEKHLCRKVQPAEVPVLINGDDILFRANDALYTEWQATIRHLGLSLSVGKSYFHKNTFTLNSEMYKCRGDGLSEECYDKIEFLNVGLLRKAFADKTLPAHFCAVAPCLSEVLKGAQSRNWAFRRFKRHWRQEIEASTRGGLLSLFLPAAAGGLGVEAHDVDFYVTRKQAQLAHVMLEHASDAPLEHAKLTPAVVRKSFTSSSTVRKSQSYSAHWTHDRQMDRLPDTVYSDLSGERRQDSEFDAWESPLAIFQKTPNAVVWRKAMRLIYARGDISGPLDLRPSFLREDKTRLIDVLVRKDSEALDSLAFKKLKAKLESLEEEV